jgi:hypothetical protein
MVKNVITTASESLERGGMLDEKREINVSE